MTERTVVHLTRSAWGGGQERFVRQLADEAVERGWRCVVAHYDREPPAGAKAEYLAISRGATFRRWPIAFGGILRRLRPDIVHLHGAMPGSVGAVVAKASVRGGIVFTDHAVHRQLPVRDRLLRRTTSRVPDTSISVCRAGLASLLDDARVRPDRAHLVPYGTADAPVATPPDGSERRLLCVANFWPHKSQASLVRALTRLDQDVVVDFVGDGGDRPGVERLAAGLGIAPRVRFRGHLDDPWQRADGAWALVHPSIRDAMPLAVAEAMMRGLPVVASRLAGIAELVEDGRSGLLVPPGDEDALAGTLGRILADRTLRDRLADGARRFAVSNLSLTVSLDRNFEVYASCRAERR